MHKTNYKLLDELDWLYDRIKFFKNNGYEKEKFFKETIEKYYSVKNLKLRKHVLY